MTRGASTAALVHGGPCSKRNAAAHPAEAYNYGPTRISSRRRLALCHTLHEAGQGCDRPAVLFRLSPSLEITRHACDAEREDVRTFARPCGVVESSCAYTLKASVRDEPFDRVSGCVRVTLR
ncbi:hypothetical protein MRX96_027139 [Rhipicephalus microplus]